MNLNVSVISCILHGNRNADLHKNLHGPIRMVPVRFGMARNCSIITGFGTCSSKEAVSI